MLDWILMLGFGCWHEKYTFPITPKRGHGIRAARLTGMYVACLNCGREFAYDWQEMRVISDGEAVQIRLARMKALADR